MTSILHSKVSKSNRHYKVAPKLLPRISIDSKTDKDNTHIGIYTDTHRHTTLHANIYIYIYIYIYILFGPVKPESGIIPSKQYIYIPTPPHRQDVSQGLFSSRV